MGVSPAPLHEHAHHEGRWLIGVTVAFAAACVAIALLAERGVFRGSSEPSALRGSGVAAAQSRNLAPFSSIDLTGSNVVTIRVGSKQSVVVHADDNLLGRVTTRVENGRLAIGDKPGNFTPRSPMYVDVHVPSLEALRLSGSGVLVATGITGPRLTAAIEGSGVLRLSGRTGRLRVDLGGSGDAQLQQLVASDVRAVVGGSGRIFVTATRSLHASIPGSGAIVYTGNPTNVVTSVAGSGTVVRR